MHSLFLLAPQSRLRLCIFHKCRIRFSSSLSAVSSLKGDCQSYDVSCRGSGSIRVDVFRQHLLKDPATPLVIYFPPTGVHSSNHHPPIPSYLHSASTALARINYRWNIPQPADNSCPSPRLRYNFVPDYHPFPFPIHDTHQAWKFITTTYLPSLISNGSTEVPKLEHRRPIIIFGEFLGASIATSLALTENYEGFVENNAYDIRLIAKQGVFDWVDIGTTLLTKASAETIWLLGENKNLGLSWNKLTLLGLREHLFSGPCKCLDAFISPMLFFRQVGLSAPMNWDDLTQPSSYFCPCFAREFDNSSKKPKKNSKKSDDGDSEIINKDILSEIQNLRITHTSLTYRPYLEFPSMKSGLRIPESLFLFRNWSPKEDESNKILDNEIPPSKLSQVTPFLQAEAMSDLMRRSVSTLSYTLRDPQKVIQVKEIKDNFNEEQKVVQDWLETIT
ncbi:hypothetical protein Golomagni_04083 [Golovinomyces magnicellulatus]|nr:hypothetical protein Golomagni_04083 [Golovinomyces magnicellulatus]